jgi:hypothetical protein
VGSWIGHYELSEADDDFHPADDHPWFFEGVWFSFHVPERKLQGYIYLKFWPNQRVYGGGALVWDHTATLPWEVPYCDFHWHEPWPAVASLKDCRLPNGIGIRCLEPLTRYRVTFDSARLRVDMTWEAIVPAFAQRRGDVPFLFAGHIDHPGRVRGEMVLDGERIALDCAAMRDRSWGPRIEDPGLRMGYCHAANVDGHAFLALSNPQAEGDPITGGYRLRDGEVTSLVRGRRIVERSARGHPTHVRVEAEDDKGRPFVARGHVLSRMGFRTHHGIFHWLSYTEWRFDDCVGWGEDEDLWHPDLWRAYYRRHVLSAG